MKEQTKLTSGRVHESEFVVAARNLWPIGYILGFITGTLLAFAWVWR
jgi:hypothetical protein